MKRKEIIKATVVFAIALAFIMPGATAFTDSATIGVTSNSENTGDIENIVENTIDNGYSDILETEEDSEENTDISDETDDDGTEPLPATGIIIYVDDDNTMGPWDGTWEHPYQYIKDGISNANPGDSINVLNGIYNEYNIQVNKQLDITGQSRENTIIDGGSSYGDVVKITADYVNISTLTVKKAYKYGSKSIYAYKVSNFIIKNCDISSYPGKGYGIYAYGNYPPGTSSDVDVINCEIYNAQYGIYILLIYEINVINCTTHDIKGNGIKLASYGVGFSIKNCVSYNNTGSGIHVDAMAEGDIIGCTTYNNKYSGIALSNSDYVNVVNCITHHNIREGIKMGSGYNDPENCNITTCTSYNNSYGIYLDAIDCILTGNTLYDNGCNFVIPEKAYLNHNIDPTNTVNGKPIWYLVEQENIILDETYNFGYLGLVSCNNITAKNAVAEGVAIAYTTNSTLSNITVSGAYQGFYFYGGSNIKIEKCTASGNVKYGFYIYYTDNLEITECTATDMTKGSSAFAFHIEGSPGVNITNCIAHDVGQSYGIKIYACPNANLINCQAYNGGPTYATGIALYASPYTNLVNCTVHHFQRGITIRGDCPFTNVTDCTAHSLTYEGFEADASDCNYLNCTVYNAGGFTPFNSARSTFTNCKSYDNKAGVTFYHGLQHTFTNCEIYNNSGNGVDIHSNSYGNTFINCEIYDNNKLLDSYGNPIGYGVLIEDNSYGTILTDCDVYNNNYGVYISASPNNILRGIALSGNNHEFDVVGSINDLYQDIDTSNTINGDPIYYLVDEENMTIGPTDAGIGYLRLISCNNMTIQNLDIPGTGLMIIQTTNSMLFNVSVHDGKEGIRLWGSSDNDVTGCDVYNNTGHGIYIVTSPDNSIVGCTVYDNTGNGIYLLNSPTNTITGCTAYDNNYGIYLKNSPNNVLRSSTLNNNNIGFGVTGTATADFYQDIDAFNEINGKPIYYRVGDSYNTIDETHDFGYLILVACDNMVLKNLDVADLLIILTTNSMLSNIEAHDGKDGIYLWGSSYNEITGCTVYDNTGYGIYLRDSHNNDIDDCTLYSNNYGIYLTGSSHNTIMDCTASEGSSGFYLTGSSNENTIGSCDSYNNGNGFYFVSSTGNDLMDCSSYGNTQGIYLSSSSNSDIVNCDVYDNSNGFYLLSSNSNNIIGCEVYSNSKGFFMKSSSYNLIENCDISDNPNGIYMDSTYSARSRYNTIKDCDIHGSSNGIYFYYGEEYNTIMDCNIYNNGNGVYYKGYYTKYNKAYHNTFASNTKNAYTYKTPNYWDDGYPSGGNYWDDYSGIDIFSGPSQNITGSDGIGDTPYVSGKVKDNYPLMNPIIPTPPPAILDVTATPGIQNTTAPVNITCTVIDYVVQVDTVKLHIDGPEGFTLEEEMSESYWYENIYAIMGVYNYYIWANNTLGSESTSDTYSFIISDIDVPISAVDPLPTWINDVTFTVTATAFDNTGLENVTLWSRYSSDETVWTEWAAYGTDTEAPWSWSFTSTDGDGYYEFYSIAVDDYGNVENTSDPLVADASCGLDTTPPVTTIHLSGTMGGDDWYISSSVNFTLSAIDQLSGVESTWYRVDSGYWTLYLGEVVTVSGDGRHTVDYYSFDSAGNREDTNTTEIKIDPTAPETTHDFDGMMYNEWYVSDVEVTLTANDRPPTGLSLFERILERLGILRVDTSGVNYTMYKIDSGEWINYTEPFWITEDGEYIIYYYSVDLAGNVETDNEVILKIDHDEEPPVTTHDFDGVMGENNWYVSDVKVTLTATDNAAGVNFTMYRVDEGAWEEYTGMFRVTEDGSHTLEYFSVDYLVNEETVKGPFGFKIDKTKPEIIDFTVEEAGFMKWLLTATVADETSGINRVEFYVDDTYVDNVTNAPYELVYSGTGDYAQVIVYDNAGHQSISEKVQGHSQPQSTTGIKTQNMKG